MLHDFFAVVPGGLKIVGGCRIETRDFDPVRVWSDVNTTALFGMGWIDRISAKRSVHRVGRSFEAIGKELFGRSEWHPTGTCSRAPRWSNRQIRLESTVATLEEFVASACANELGLGTPMMEQAKPWAHGSYTKVNADLNSAQFRSLVAFVDTLPRQVEVMPVEPTEGAVFEHGKALFGQIGCASCHTPEIGGVAGIYSDSSSTESPTRVIWVADMPRFPPHHCRMGILFRTNGRRHRCGESPNSAPYFHDGASPTLETAIRRHQGDAASVTRAFESLPTTDRQAIVRFLKGLRAPTDARPARLTAQGTIAMAR